MLIFEVHSHGPVKAEQVSVEMIKVNPYLFEREIEGLADRSVGSLEGFIWIVDNMHRFQEIFKHLVYHIKVRYLCSGILTSQGKLP